ncbi:hypothetical protein Bca52824_007697 [Brassica carinata]|uniref:Uncharacterized protein n=1 Tax=Brassica carinata TaxID=52824 RepID=A0A8X8B844_BRACI|nr:hypothetical protein Bca52824_007696 [Brassica carinata]KAG2324969.1 hypothetical protein Bca52824_007697 [Brassica carinata]
MFNEDPYNIPDSWKTEEEEEENAESELPPDFENVQPRYDHDSGPFDRQNLGGSDIAEVMVGIHVPKLLHTSFKGPALPKFEPKETGVLSFPHTTQSVVHGTTDIPSKGPYVQHPYASRCTNTTTSAHKRPLVQ